MVKFIELISTLHPVAQTFATIGVSAAFCVLFWQIGLFFRGE